MLNYLILPLSFITFFFSSIQASNSTTKDKMKAELEVIRQSFEVGYAAKEWKKQYANWDLDEQLELVKERIEVLPNPTDKDYQHLVHQFFNSAKDYHVGVQFWSTESATLPFELKSIDTRHFITQIDTQKLSPLVFPIFEGDEIISFNGKPIDEVFNNFLLTEERQATTETDRSLADFHFTHRMGSLGHTVPKGSILLTIKSHHTGKISEYQLIWEYSPEKISHAAKIDYRFSARQKKDASTFIKLLTEPQLLAPEYTLFSDSAQLKNINGTLGARESIVPLLGKVWWESEPTSFFKAYLYETEDQHMMGYVRIPTYVGTDKEINEFATLIQLFEERAEALVIDQIDNPGGSALFLYGLTSMLTDKPLVTPQHRMALQHKDVNEALTNLKVLNIISSDQEAIALLGPTLYGIPVTHQGIQFFINYCNFIVDEWNAGHLLTGPSHLFSIDYIQPHPSIRFTKPLLVLINGLDTSGGDFFPAIMQDNKRATLLGTRTAGAGGYVHKTEFPSRFGIKEFTYTASIALRQDQSPLETLGVNPDIPYQITVEDVQFNYTGYGQAINQAVSHLLNQAN